MKATLESIDGVQYLTFKVSDEIGLTRLPVITPDTIRHNAYWTFDGNLERPTLRPSVRTSYYNGSEMTGIHYWLTDGVVNCLHDSTDGNAGKMFPLMDL